MNRAEAIEWLKTLEQSEISFENGSIYIDEIFPAVFAEALTLAISALEAEHWIKVDGKYPSAYEVPKPEERVLAIQSNGTMMVAYIDSDSGHWYDEYGTKLVDPTHYKRIVPPEVE